MIRISELKLPLAALPLPQRRAADAPAETEADRAAPPHPIEALCALAAATLGVAAGEIAQLQVFKRAFDARGAQIRAVYIVDVALVDPATEEAALQRLAHHPHVQRTPDMTWRPPAVAHAFGAAPGSTRPVVVGFGPCGILAALTLAEMGLRPIVLERGRPVRQRTQDTWGLWRRRILNPESNVQFGEGGAGLFSDGKLYSQVKDPRHLGRRVLQLFVEAGAPADILFEAHPHIGTFRLVKVVQGLRARIEALGGEVRFEQRVEGFVVAETRTGRQQLRALRVRDLARGELHELPATHVVLALGHSARDTFEALHAAGVPMQPKPFSIGVRIEHPQSLIDRARWGRHAGHPLLGAAAYKLVHHVSNGRGVYSFCMCPGGTVVAATSEPGRVVTNGMSQYSRAERNANAGLVVGIAPADFAPYESDEHPGPLAGIGFQRHWEAKAFAAGGGNYRAPAQRVGDFLAGRPSTALGAVIPSYKPGVTPSDLSLCLPGFAVAALREALPAFGRQIPGFDMEDAVMTGVETRTSSPVRITRDDSFQSVGLRGLYPAGEGAGYAGGILSAAVDGIRVAEAVSLSLLGAAPLRDPSATRSVSAAYG
ncbi:MAG: FAD-dependent oxidoreductase [Tepidimonas sp.]|nr:FAD-dependent oxidoreductase [Tepidimonas sp.]